MPTLTAVCLVPSEQHVFPGHPERPERLEGFPEALSAVFPAVRVIPASAASATDLERAHPPEYLDALQAVCPKGPGYIDPAPTYVTPGSYECALLAAGGTLAVLDEIIDGHAQSGFAVVRPPGHHATADQAMGFCLLNNIAIAARHAQARGVRRVMIFDFDVHHGNGTQAITEADADVLYVSTHQEGIYPLTGWPEEVGTGAGDGTVVNLPLPDGTGDRGLLEALERIAAPTADRFGPQMILVSAGFDPHWRDPLAGFQVTTNGFYSIASRLAQLAHQHCDGHVLFALEGGYDAAVVREGILACVAAVLGEPLRQDRLGPAPHPEPDISDRIARYRSIHSL